MQANKTTPRWVQGGHLKARGTTPTPKPAPKPALKPKPTPKPKPVLTPVLSLGSRGTAVKNLQAGLLRVFPAYAGPIRTSGGADGVFGTGTRAVVIEFQRRSGLTRDGIVGAATRAALAKYGIRF